MDGTAIRFCDRLPVNTRETAMLDHYCMFADYNRWANRLLYQAVSRLSDEQYRENKGAFFGSLHATLNHLLAADRIWMKRFTGTGDAPSSLDAILFADLAALSAARATEDERIAAWVYNLTEAELASRFTYTSITNPVTVTQRLAPVLAHFFNHQTHHRGQCHATLTALGQPSVILDLVYFLRTAEGQKWAA
jgi:uncharacterized damage-inducible protein DinB